LSTLMASNRTPIKTVHSVATIPGTNRRSSKGGVKMSTETLVIVIVVLLLLGGGGWGYSRWRG
jgi:hypothetical protein